MRRGRRASEMVKQNSLALIKPHKSVTSCTVAQWLKALLQAAGVDTSIFSAHLVHGASSSKTANMGITTNDILKAANWSTESVFLLQTNNRCVLWKSGALNWWLATNNTVDMWDWAFWRIILEWLRPRSGCILFEIIRGRWGQAYQRFHPPNPVWGMCACIYSSFVYVFSVSFNWTYQLQRQELIKGWSGACAVGFIMDLTTPNWVWLPWSLIFSCFELESRPNTVDMLDLTFLV